MLIRITKDCHTAGHGALAAGDELEASPKDARSLIDGGCAELADKPKKKGAK